MADGKIIIETGLDNSGIEKGLSKLDGIAKKGLGVVKNTATATAAAMTAAGTAAIVVGSNFEEGMSEVSAISGATGKALNDLTAKAKEMGAKTKFSATEAASAFKYMAMAGWKTTDMLNGIDGIMNLAAASGEDLALVSDIVTDAITAFGLSASDSSHFADVLATASSNANTNVSMLGESFKYVAPIAGAMKYSVEDTSLALGLMANASIKGSMAGTSLKTSLANLASPTDDMADVMEKYGISLTNSDGSMRSLGEMVKLLRDKMGGLNEATQTAAASTLFGKEAMAGMLAIINASEEDYQKLSKAIYNADGTAQNMADTMQDNLKGSITILKSGLEGLGIQIYESMEEPLKNAAQRGIKNVDRLSKSFSKGGFKGAVKEAGKIVDEFTDELADSNKKAGSVIKPLKNMTDAALKLGKTALPPTIKAMELTVKNLDKIVPLTIAGCTAYKTYAVVTKAVTAAKKANAAATKLLNRMDRENALQLVASNGGLTVRQTLMALNNGQITIATAGTGLWAKAQMGLNAAMTANPIGLLTAAVGALAVGIGAYVLMTDNAFDSTYKLTEEQEKSIVKAKELRKSYEDMDNARQESMKSVQTEFGHYEELKDELVGLIDKNGKVKKGYEERAKFIVNQLSSALGMEEEQIWEIIKSNGNLEESIDKVIQKKKAEAILLANEQAYTEAIQKRDEALASYQENLEILDEAEKKYNKTKKEGKEYAELLASGNVTLAESYYKAHKKEIQANEEAEESYKKAKKAVKNSEEAYVGYVSTIQNYEGMSAAILSGDAKKIDAEMQNITNSFITAETGTKKTLEKQVENMESHYKELKKAVENGTPGVTQEMVNQAKKMMEKSKKELEKASKQVLPEISKALSNVGITASQSMLDAISSQKPKVQKETIGLLNQIHSGVSLKEKELITLFKNLGIDTSNSLIGALSGKEASVQAEGIELISQLQTAEGKKREEIIKQLERLGIDSGTAYEKSIKSKKKDVNEAAETVVSEPVRVAESKGLKAKGTKLGGDFGTGYAGGILGKLGEVSDAAAETVKTAINRIKKEQRSNSPAKETIELGEDYGDGYALGIKDKIPVVEKVNEEMVGSALSGIDVGKQIGRMRAAMSNEKAIIGANMTTKIMHEFVMGDFTSKLSELKLGIESEDIRKLAKEFSIYVAEDIANEMDGMGIHANNRELFRMFREASKA